MINTHKGLFSNNQLTFSVNSVPPLFQQMMDAMPTGLIGIATFTDNIIVASETQDELLNRLVCLWSDSAI